MTLQAVIPFAQFIERATVDENPEVLASVTDAQTHQTPFETSIQAQTSKFLYALENYPGLSTAAALTQAAIDANGATIKLKPGQTYNFASGATVTNIPFNLDATGAFMKRTATAANEPIITVTGDITNVQVVSIAPATFNYGGGATDVTAITVPDVSPYAVNDNLKIVSDDLLPESDPADRERAGDIVVIGAIVGSVIYTLSPVRETMVTNIRIGKMQRMPVSITGMDASDATGYPVGRNRPLLQVIAVNDLVINGGNFHDAAAGGIVLYSCARFTWSGGESHRLRTSAGNFADGYPLVYYGCVDGKITGGNFSQARHGTTEGCVGTTVNDPSLYKYGGGIECVTETSVATNMDSAGFDLHPSSLNCGFIGVKSTHSIDGPSGSEVNIQLRGRGGYAKSCVTVGGAGVIAFVTRDASLPVVVENHTHYRHATDTTASPPIRFSSSAAAPLQYRFSGTVTTNTTSIPSVTTSNAVGTVDLTEFATFSGTSAFRSVELDAASTMVLTARIAPTANGGTNPRVAKVLDDNSTLIVQSLDYRFGATWVLADMTSHTGKAVFRNVTYLTAPSATTGGFSNATTASVFVELANSGQTAAGSTIADAFRIRRATTVFSTVAASTGALLPPASLVGLNEVVVVYNDGANPLKIYATGDTIDGVAGATGVTLTNALRCAYRTTTTSGWKSSQLGATSA